MLKKIPSPLALLLLPLLQAAEDGTASDGERPDHPATICGPDHFGVQPACRPASPGCDRADEGGSGAWPDPFCLPGETGRLLLLWKAVNLFASPPQKMLQCPYYFFDVLYIHNGTEEKEETTTSWKVGRLFWDPSGPSSLASFSHHGPSMRSLLPALPLYAASS